MAKENLNWEIPELRSTCTSIKKSKGKTDTTKNTGRDIIRITKAKEISNTESIKVIDYILYTKELIGSKQIHWLYRPHTKNGGI